MPSDDEIIKQAEEWKTKGNESFQKSEFQEAIQSYSQGVVQVDRILAALSSPSVAPATIISTKTALLSNRGMCYLKVMQFQNCIDDCTLGLDLLQQSTISGTEESNKLRSKLLFRRAKAKFLLANLPPEVAGIGVVPIDVLNEAAKDILTLLSFDSSNADASSLLKNIRAQHAAVQKSFTPVSKTMDKIRQNKENITERIHQLKVLLGLLDNDSATNGMELGRRGGVQFLLDLALGDGSASTDSNGSNKTEQKKIEEAASVRSLAMQCISCAGSHPPFVRAYCKDIQKQLLQFLKQDDDLVQNLPISVLALYLRLILHLDRDDPNKKVAEEVSGHSNIENRVLLDLVKTSFEKYDDISIIRATIEILTNWTAGPQRDALVLASLENSNYTGSNKDDVHVPATKSQMDQMSAKELATYKAFEREKKNRDDAWAYERARLFVDEGGLDAMLERILLVEHHSVRREMTVVLGRVLAAIDDNDQLKKIAQPYLVPKSKGEDDEPKIQEIYNDDEVKENDNEEEEVVEENLQTLMRRAAITNGLLLSCKEIGAWCILHGWDTSDVDLEKLIDSNDSKAMCMASEVIAAASAVDRCVNYMTTLLDNGLISKLIVNEDRDIRSGAASAMAKLGLSETNADEGEVMGLLQAASDLLEQEEEEDDIDNKNGEKEKNKGNNNSNKSENNTAFAGSTFATASIERGVEMVNYLISHTNIKDEIASGFRAGVDSKETTLQRLVSISCRPNSGESLSGFGLATIFQHMAVTSETLRNEHFETKEFSAEEYDQLQRMAKTQEERDLMDQQKPDDSEDACADRIRRMANANVPRALVALSEGGIKSEGTLEQIVLAMSRLAVEESARGLMIQQGVLSALIKIEKEDSVNKSKLMKKIARTARHTIAKLLITTNPTILTSAQRMGAIKPLISMIREVEAKELQQFEGLLAITNIASSGEDTKNRIIAEKGISSLHFCMFSQNPKIRCAATEAMCNLVPHKAMMDHLRDPEHMRLWLAFSADYEENFECARAAIGCLAMATQDPDIANAVVDSKIFQREMNAILESGQGELMHRCFVLILNLVSHGDKCLQATKKAGLIAFSQIYVQSYHDGSKLEELELSRQDKELIMTTLDLAKDIIRKSD